MMHLQTQPQPLTWDEQSLQSKLQNHWTYDLETTSQIGRKAISVNKQRTHQVIFSFITTSLETAPLRGK